MDARQIAEQLQRDRGSSQKIHSLIGEIGRRRTEVMRRQEEITPSPFRNPIVADAVIAGPDAAAELEEEAKALAWEADYLDNLEQEAERLKEAARREEIKTRLPVAMKQYPDALNGVRQAMAGFDAAIARLNEIVVQLAEYDDAGLPHPLPDAKLAELLQLRNDVWTVRNVAVLYPSRPGSQLDPRDPDDAGAYPASWKLMFEKIGERVRRIGPPRQRKAE